MNLLGEKHPHFVLRAVVKALTIAETTYREWKSSTSKPLNNKYKRLSDKREECKKKYKDLPRLEYLKRMGHILMEIKSLKENGGDKNGQDSKASNKKKKKPDPIVETADQTFIVNDVSRSVDPLANVESEDEFEPDHPYSNRVVGQGQGVQNQIAKRPPTFKKKCPKCHKGFNCNSRYKTCHLCDKHIYQLRTFVKMFKKKKIKLDS